MGQHKLIKMFSNISKLMLEFDYGNSIGEMRIWSIKTVVPPEKQIDHYGFFSYMDH